MEKMLEGGRKNVKYSTHIYKTSNTHRFPPPSPLPLLKLASHPPAGQLIREEACLNLTV